MRAIVVAVLCACGGAGHTRRVQASADPRSFCAALYRGDLAAASDAAATWLSWTGAAPGSDERVRTLLQGWLVAQACVADVERSFVVQPDACVRSFEILLQPWTRRRARLFAFVHGDGRVKLVDATWFGRRCGER